LASLENKLLVGRHGGLIDIYEDYNDKPTAFKLKGEIVGISTEDDNFYSSSNSGDFNVNNTESLNFGPTNCMKIKENLVALGGNERDLTLVDLNFQ
jgi:hypothetical protein